MKNTTLKQLRSVAAIIRNGRIVNAAKELNLTTPAVTSQLKLIETELGLTLFDRTQTGMRPTAAGWEVFRTASRIEDLLRECREKIDDLMGLRHGTITIGVVSTGKYFAPQLIAAFMREHPHVDVQLFVGNRDAIVEALRDYRVDMAIMGRPPEDFEVDAKSFGRHPLVIVASPEHPLVGQKRIAKRVVARERFLIREEGSGTRAAFETFFEGLQVKGTPTGMEIGSNEQAGGDGGAWRRADFRPFGVGRTCRRPAGDARRRRPPDRPAMVPGAARGQVAFDRGGCVRRVPARAGRVVPAG
jgi:DNA-binding transcriptional LysR family regulator